MDLRTARLRFRGRVPAIAIAGLLIVAVAISAALAPRVMRALFPSAAGGMRGSWLPGSAYSPAGVAARADLLHARLDEAWRLSDWAAATEALAQLVDLYPANSALRDRLYQARIHLGWQLLADHRFAQAAREFTLALQMGTAGEEARQGLALLQQLVVVPGGLVPSPTPPPAITPLPPVVSPTPPPAAVVTPVPEIVAVAAAPAVSTPVPAAAVCVVCPTVCVPVCPVVVCQPIVAKVCPATCPAVCQSVIQPACPRPCAIVHVVQRGEDLFHIALRFQVNVAVLMQVNCLTSATVKAGQVLLIP